jgi:hypothetical protein
MAVTVLIYFQTAINSFHLSGRSSLHFSLVTTPVSMQHAEQ